jgi:hypothetical protein
MAEYRWEFGIDWNAIEPAGVGYLRGGLAKKVDDTDVFLPVSGIQKVEKDDTVTFRLVDITSSVPPSPNVQWVASINYFSIFTQAACKDQPADLDPWSLSPLTGPLNLMPTLTQDSPPGQATVFGTAAYCSWTPSASVTVADHPGRRFLLTTQVQATGLDGVVRLFSHDPEMVVGGEGG